MKTLKTTIILTVMFLSMQNVFAQTKFGFTGGLNISDLKVPNIKEINSESSFGTGLFFEHFISEKFSIVTEPAYIQKNATVVQFGSDPNIGTKLSFIDIPVMLKYSIGETIRPYLLCGASAAINLTSEFNTSLAGLNFSLDAGEITEDIEFNILAGAGAAFETGIYTFFIEGKYYLGLTNLQKGGRMTFEHGALTTSLDVNEVDHSFKTRNFVINAGIAVSL